MPILQTWARKAALLLAMSQIMTGTLSAASPAGDSAFAARRDAIIRALAATNPDYSLNQGHGKNNLPHALARLYLSDGKDSAARDYVSKAYSLLTPEMIATWGNEGDPMFIWLGVARCYSRYRDHFTPEQTARLKSSATGFRRWWKGDTSIYPLHTNPVPAGTENHKLMYWSSVYLLAQAWPDARWYRDSTGPVTFSSAEAMARARGLIAAMGRNAYAYGNSEFLSPTYELFHLAPLLNLRDFAQDPGMKAVAEGFLAYLFSVLAVNDQDGHLLEPLTRNSAQANGKGLALSQFVPWVYWGQGNPDMSEISAGEGRFSVYLAASDYRPWPMLGRIALGAVALPFADREVKGFWEANPPRYCMRSAWRHPLYAIGAGVTRTEPGYYVIDDAMFAIAWRSARPLNYLQCFHPYYYSDRGEDEWKAPTSPFQAWLQHKGTALVLFDIPKADPYREPGWNAAWLDTRRGHFDSLIALGQCRFPKAVDAFDSAGGWWFLREGDVYVGIHPLRPGAELADLGDFRALKSRANRTGFVFEVGAKAERGDFAAFQAACRAHSAEADWQQSQVSYRNLDGDSLRLRFRPAALAPPGNSVPEAWINGQAVDYAAWPVMDNPFVQIRGRVLAAAEGGESYGVDWSGEIPALTGGGAGFSGHGHMALAPSGDSLLWPRGARLARFLDVRGKVVAERTRGRGEERLAAPAHKSGPLFVRFEGGD